MKEISRETGMSCGNVQRIRRGIYGKIRTFASASVSPDVRTLLSRYAVKLA